MAAVRWKADKWCSSNAGKLHAVDPKNRLPNGYGENKGYRWYSQKLDVNRQTNTLHHLGWKAITLWKDGWNSSRRINDESISRQHKKPSRFSRNPAALREPNSPKQMLSVNSASKRIASCGALVRREWWLAQAANRLP